MKQEDVGKVIDRSFNAQSFIDTHARRITDHYLSAREKHHYFCDEITGYNSHVASFRLKQIRDLIDWRKAHKCVTAEMLLRCELLEAEDAYLRGNKSQAVEELYDAIAVCLRTIDVLEGRQKLGKPEMKGETK